MAQAAEHLGREFEQLFGAKSDPWRYATERHQERLRLAVQMLDSLNIAKPFERAIEAGCAEGAFTESLATRCRKLLAADISAVAPERARTPACMRECKFRLLRCLPRRAPRYV